MIVLGDCYEVIPRLVATGSVDLVFTDPPYGITQNKWDQQVDLGEFWKMVNRIVKPSGVVAVFACQPFTSRLIVSNEKKFRCEWILHKTKKTGFLNARKMPLRSHESVIIFANPGHLYQPQMTHGHKPVNTFEKRAGTDGTNYGKTTSVIRGGGQTSRYPESVLRVPWVGSTSPERVGAPTQKPVSICEYFLATYSKPEDLVVDMFMGSGSIGVACARMGRKFVGVDNDKRSFEMAEKRLR